MAGSKVRAVRRLNLSHQASMIPHIIHQLWKTREVPEDLREFQQSWITHHPDWEYRLWTDEDNHRLVREHYPHYVEVFESLTPPIVKIDFIRLAYMHRFGGIYADMDFEALRPLDSLVSGDRIVVGRENGGIGISMRGRPFIINAFLASPAGHPLWLEIMQAMAARFRPRRRFESHPIHVIRMTIEIFDELVEAHARDHDDIIIHSHEPFYPAPPSVRLVETRRELAHNYGSYAIHHYENTWFSPSARLLNVFMEFWQRRILQRPCQKPH